MSQQEDIKKMRHRALALIHRINTPQVSPQPSDTEVVNSLQELQQKLSLFETASQPLWSTDGRDQTFQRVCVARVDVPYSPVIYVHPENGNLTRDVIDAQGFLSKKIGASLRTTMEFAQKTHPGGLGWEYCRVLWQVIPFADQTMVEGLIQADIRRTAELKLKSAGLTADEMASLGL